MLFKNTLWQDKEYWFVYFIRFKKDFVKTKFNLWYDIQVDLWFWKDSVKIWSTHNKSRIYWIGVELYEHDLWIENIDIIRVIKCKDYRLLESHIQKKFKSKKCAFKHEFFNLTDEEIFDENYNYFWYMWDSSEMKLLYIQYKYFLKALNCFSPNSYLKTKWIWYNRLFWWNLK